MSAAKSKPKKSPSRRAGRGALYVIAGLLVASGLVRLGGDTGQAIAKGLETMVPEGGEMQSHDMPESGLCEGDEEIMALLTALQAREVELDSRDLAIRDRMQALNVADTQISAKLIELQEAETALAAIVASAAALAANEMEIDDDIATLTSVYENMKPKDAAELFEEMSPEFAAGFLSRMRPDAAAAIMAGLEPRAAYTISVMMAGRNVELPEQ